MDTLRTAASDQDQHPGLCLEPQGTRDRWVRGQVSSRIKVTAVGSGATGQASCFQPCSLY